MPSLKEVQEKIEARYAKAKAISELGEVTVESRILEIEQATANVEAQSRLSQLRAELGLASEPRPPAPRRRRGSDGRSASRRRRTPPRAELARSRRRSRRTVRRSHRPAQN